ncbi:histidine phosphatase family protein [Streptomyces sp. NPDC002519]
MTSRVTLISPAMNAALRQARFDDGCPLDAAGAARARSAAGSPPPADRVLVSPTVRCRETASALGLAAAAGPAPAGLDVGRWRGRTLEEVGVDEPDAAGLWLADPSAAPHGGESVHELCARVGGWLDETAQLSGRTVAVVEPEIVRAVVVRVLAAPDSAFWRIDVPPLTATEFTGRAGRWNMTLGTALGCRSEVGAP